MFCRKMYSKRRVEDVQRLARAVDRNGRLPGRLLQEAHIVDALGVVGVVVGVEDRAHLPDAGIQALRAQVRRGVDQDRGVALPQGNRDTAAPVLRVVGIAVAPMRPQQRDAAGAAAAEDGDLHAAALSNSVWKLAVVRAASCVERQAEHVRDIGRGVAHEARLVALAAHRHRREVGRVRLHQQPVERHGLRDLRAAPRRS